MELIVSVDDNETKSKNVLILNSALNSVTDEVIEPSEKVTGEGEFLLNLRF